MLPNVSDELRKEPMAPPVVALVYVLLDELVDFELVLGATCGVVPRGFAIESESSFWGARDPDMLGDDWVLLTEADSAVEFKEETSTAVGVPVVLSTCACLAVSGEEEAPLDP